MIINKWTFVHCCILSFHLSGSIKLFVTKPTQITMTRLWDCPDVKPLLPHNISMKRITRTAQAYDVDFILPRDFDHDFKISIEISRWRDGSGWKHNLLNFKEDGHYCEYMNNILGEFWFKLQAAFIPPMPKGVCPWPKGSYKLRKHVLDFNDMKIPALFDGRFLVKSQIILKPNTTYLCLLANFIVEQIPQY